MNAGAATIPEIGHGVSPKDRRDGGGVRRINGDGQVRVSDDGHRGRAQAKPLSRKRYPLPHPKGLPDKNWLRPLSGVGGGVLGVRGPGGGRGYRFRDCGRRNYPKR